MAHPDDDLLWSDDQLLALTRAEGEETRAWALGRLAGQSPAAANARARELLADPARRVRVQALEVLEAHAGTADAAALAWALEGDVFNDRVRAAVVLARTDRAAGLNHLEQVRFEEPEHAEPLLALAKLDPERAAAALGARLREADAEDEALPRQAYALARPAHLPDLLAFWSEQPDEGRRSWSWLLLQLCGAEDLVDLAGDDDPIAAFAQEGGRLASAAGGLEPLAAAWGKRDWREVAAGAERLGRAIGAPPAGTATEAALALLEAAARQPPTRHLAALAATALLALRRRAALAAALPGLDLKGRLELLGAIEAERELAWLVPEVAQAWAAAPAAERGPVAELVLAWVRNDPEAWPHQLPLALALEGFPLAAFFEALPEDDEGALEDAEAALRARPELLRALAPAVLAQPEHPLLVSVLALLEEQPRRWAARLLLEAAPALLTSRAGDLVWGALEAHALPESVELAVREWRPGEPQLAEAALTLAERTGAEGRLPAPLRQEARAERERLRALRASDDASGPLGADDALPLTLPLRCTRCGRRGTYAFESAIVHPDRRACERLGCDGVTLPRIVVCKYCGAEDAYALTPEAKLTLTARLIGRSPGEAPGPGERLQVAEPHVAGGHFRTQSDALRALRDRQASHPQQAEWPRRLGNLLSRLGRLEEARAAWERAAGLDPREAEAPAALAQDAADRGDAPAALRWAGATLQRLPQAEAAPPLRRALAEAAVGVLRRLAPGRAAPLFARLSWTRTPAARSGRVVQESRLELRGLERWGGLTELFSRGHVVAAQLADEAPEQPAADLLACLAELEAAPEAPASATVVHEAPRVGRNDLCPCGSGKKYKKCHGA